MMIIEIYGVLNLVRLESANNSRKLLQKAEKDPQKEFIERMCV